MSANRSDFDYFVNLNSVETKGSPLEEHEVYKACIIEALNGQRNTREQHLNSVFQKLLEIRRDLYLTRFTQARNRMKALSETIVSSEDHPRGHTQNLVRGDLEFLWGLYSSLKGDHRRAGEKMNQAAHFYSEGQEIRRLYKAKVNEQISIYNSIHSYQTGSLYAFNHAAKSQAFYDISGNIHKSYSLELLVEGQVAVSVEQARLAQEQYSKETCLDDQAIAMALEGIGEVLLLNFKRAKGIYDLMNTSLNQNNSRVKPFLYVLQSLLSGQLPVVVVGHPLARIPWKALILKESSLKSQMIEALKVGPLTKDDIIYKLWGQNAIHESYNQRFHSLLKEVRNLGPFSIHFDGEFYRLL